MNLKQIRGQLRQIVKDMLPELIVAEIKSALYKDLADTITARLKAIEAEVQSMMQEINKRSQDAQDYLVRHVAAPIEMPSTTDEQGTPKA